MEISRVGPSSGLEKYNCTAIVDTSVILLISSREAHLDGILDLVPDCHLVLLTPVIVELQLIAEKGDTRKSHIAKWALNNLLQFFNIIEIPTTESRKKVDDILIEFAESIKKRKKVLIITADTELRDNALKKGINVMWYRKEKKGFELLTEII